MDYLFNVEMPTAVKLIVAFAIVLLLLALVMWVFKRFGGNRIGTPAPRGRQPRLAVIDAAAVDGRRRLVLIRRDNVEHLIMIGGPTDVLIEQNIMRAVPVAPPREAPAREAPAREMSPREMPPREMPHPQQRMPVEPPVRAPVEPLAARPPRAEPPPRPSRSELPPRRPIDERYRAEPRPLPLDSPRPMRAAPAPRADLDSIEVHPAPPTADPSLADMAHKLEAALRRPPAPPRRPETSAPVPPPLALNEPTPPTAPEGNGNGARSAPAAPPVATSVEAAPAPKPATPDAKPPSKSLFDSLEEEMASLLNKPPEKGAPEKK